MNPLTLSLRQPPPDQLEADRLDLRGVVPDRLAGLSTGDIAKLPIARQARTVLLEQVFEIVDGSREALLFQGDLSQADNVGAGMRDGRLIVEGSVGRGLAADMRGGQVIVQGDAGEYAGTGMRGGLVDIAGSVRDYCAGARPGTRRGMRGGVLRVRQSAGRFLGYHMRRGTVIVAGDVAPGCGNSLIAGTIICSGKLAAPVGVGMHRGTIISLSAEAPPLHPGFTPPEQSRLSFLYLLFDAVRSELPQVDVESLLQRPMWRSLGDRASDGRGEILWPVAEERAD